MLFAIFYKRKTLFVCHRAVCFPRGHSPSKMFNTAKSGGNRRNKVQISYYKTHNICGIKFSRLNDHGILAHFNVGANDVHLCTVVAD